MEKVKMKIIALLFVLLCTGINAQDVSVIRPGLIKAQLTLSPSYMFEQKESYFYLHGNLEGFLEKNISLAGEGYYSLGNMSEKNNSFAYNHNLFFGMNYHFTTKNNDLYIGIQPGVAMAKLNFPTIGLNQPSDGVNPVVSFLIGYNFYINNYFHFFVQNRFIIGNHSYDISTNLAEYRFSAGLGFNINTIKAK